MAKRFLPRSRRTATLRWQPTVRIVPGIQGIKVSYLNMQNEPQCEDSRLCKGWWAYFDGRQNQLPKCGPAVSELPMQSSVVDV